MSLPPTPSGEPLSNIIQGIEDGTVTDPLDFLQSVMEGQDPRRVSEVYELAHQINDFSDGAPSDEDWEELLTLIDRVCRNGVVTITQGVAVAKALAEYLHPKRKHVQVEDGVGSSTQQTPLTEDEITLFKEKFDEDF